MEEIRKKFRNGIRHSKKIKRIVRQLRRTGRTHREIVKQLGISLGTAHLWTIDIRLTPSQKEAIEKRRNQPYATPEKKEMMRQIAKIRLKPYQYKEKYTQADLLRKIVDFYKKNGRIPVKREFNSYAEYKRRFGSWNKAIKAAGFQPNEVIFSKKFTASDGHICDSFSEKIIDDWLSGNEIPHQRNVPYEGTKMSADFGVDDIKIEYFGLAGVNSKYDHLITKKRFETMKNNYRLVEIYPPALFASGFKEFFIRNLRRWMAV